MKFLGSKLAKNLVGSLGGSGLSDLIGMFDKKKTDSWVSTSANEPLTPQEVIQAMPADQIEELAKSSDMTTQEVAEQLADVIPDAVNELTPEGQVAEGPALEQMVQEIVEAPAEPAPEAAAEPEPAAAQTYTVVSGDTLSAISQRFYGNANDYMRIFEANRDKLNDPNLIYPGQELVIPN